jgi:hypothetical protein
MKNRSKHYGDVTRWIEKIIESCNTWEHTKAVDKLIDNFEKQLLRDKDNFELKFLTIDILKIKLEKIKLKYYYDN